VVPVRVGDYLQVGRDGTPIPLGNVRGWPGWDALRVESQNLPDGSPTTHFAGCQRMTGLDAEIGISLPGIGGAKGTVALHFESEGGFVLAYAAAKQLKFEHVPQAQRMVLDAVRNGWWQRSWILVTEVIESTSATVIVALESSSRIDLQANAELPDLLDAIAVANPALGWASTGWEGSGFASICKPGTPLYRCARVRNSFWKGAQVELQNLEEIDIEQSFSDDIYGNV
jgi:hypothetical protein